MKLVVVRFLSPYIFVENVQMYVHTDKISLYCWRDLSEIIFWFILCFKDELDSNNLLGNNRS